MKKLISAFGLLLLFACTTENQEQDFSNSFEETIEYSEKDMPVTISIGFSGKTHRGRKWSNNQNPPVTPCTQSLGLCNMMPTIDIRFGTHITMYKPIAGDEQDLVTFVFEEAADNVYDGAIFFSDEEDPFTIHEEVSVALGYSEITIIPGNYIMEVSEEHPFGRVTVQRQTIPLGE